MFDLARAGTPILGAFLVLLVEFVEALTIVLAVGTVRGWQPALLGTVAGAAFLAALVLTLGAGLRAIPLAFLELVVGLLLLLFGMRWLRKAVLRAGGVIALHDEEAAFAQETALLRAGMAAPRHGWDKVEVATTFKAVLLEGLAAVFREARSDPALARRSPDTTSRLLAARGRKRRFCSSCRTGSVPGRSS
jgi:uncharacterized membrane protein